MRERSSMLTRLATIADIPALVSLINRAYRVEDFFVVGDRTDATEIRERLRLPNACFLVVADAAGNLAATVFVEVRGERGFFALLAVDPEQQGQGLGQTMVSAVEQHCREAGCRFLDLDTVDVRAELPAFYEKLGFKAVATAPFPKPHKLKRPAHMVLMSKPL